MRQSRSKLRFGTALLALLLLGTSLLMAAHGHSPSGPEKSETCATCHLLPYGVKLLPKSTACQIPTVSFVSTLLEPTSVAPRSAKLFFTAIRGPPAHS